MDFDASGVLTGDLTLDKAAEQLASLVGRVAAGEESKPEHLGHCEYFVMYKHQDTPSLAQGCDGYLGYEFEVPTISQPRVRLSRLI